MGRTGRVSAVMRRLALSAGALLVAASFSSCSSVDNGSTAAEVNGHRLSNDQLAALTGDTTDGEVIRQTLTTWIEVVAVTDDASGMASPEELSSRKMTALQDLLEKFGDAGRATYELGLDGSPLLCLSAIPLDASVASAKVLDELAAGTSFADAAKTYSADQTLAASGGLVKSAEGVECIAGDKFNPALIDALAKAGAAVGKPTAINLNGSEVVIQLRPYDELTLSDAERVQLSANEMGAAIHDTYAAAKISVSGRIGTWDSEQGRILAAGASLTATSPVSTAPVTTG